MHTIFDGLFFGTGSVALWQSTYRACLSEASEALEDNLTSMALFLIALFIYYGFKA